MFDEAENDDEYLLHCENASIILRLHRLLAAQLKQTGMEGAFRNIEIPLAGTLAKLELAGVSLDLDVMAKIALEFEGRLAELRQKIIELAGEEFNPNSVIELQNILYEKLRLHERYKVKPKKIKLGNGMSTDEESLEKIAEDELPRTILDYRTINKLKNTYVDQLPTFVHPASGCILRLSGKPEPRLGDFHLKIQTCKTFRSAPARVVESAAPSFLPEKKISWFQLIIVKSNCAL
jgi:DNA polymerase-1